MLRRAALEYIDKLEDHTTVEAVLETMKKALEALGVELFCLNKCANPGQKFDDVLLASRVPAEWMDLYVRENYVWHDPSQRHVKLTVHPYEWKDAPYDPEREPKVRDFVRRAHDFKVDNGLVVPIPGPTGCVGQVFMGGGNFRFSNHDMPTLHLMALYAFDRVERLSGNVMTKPNFSARQREILMWTAAGKTAWEIGEILKISQRTVEWHLRTMAEKLGTLNRMQTVMVALREQLISICCFYYDEVDITAVVVAV
jgi:LuxR family quorum sensing-dependent transcriptional regulator